MGELTRVGTLILKNPETDSYQVQVDGSPLYEIANMEILGHILTQVDITGEEMGIAVKTCESITKKLIDLDKLQTLLEPYKPKTPLSGVPKVPKV